MRCHLDACIVTNWRCTIVVSFFPVLSCLDRAQVCIVGLSEQRVGGVDALLRLMEYGNSVRCVPAADHLVPNAASSSSSSPWPFVRIRLMVCSGHVHTRILSERVTHMSSRPTPALVSHRVLLHWRLACAGRWAPPGPTRTRHDPTRFCRFD